MAVVRTGNGPAHARDIGPAAAAVDGVAALGRLSATTPPRAVPCGTCLHAPVCRLRATLDDLGPIAPVQVIESGLRAVATAWVLECDHHLAAPAGSRPIVRTAARDAESRRRGGQATKAATQRIKAERAAAVMAALARHNGDRAAAARELGMRLNALTMVAKHAELRAAAGARA